MSNPSQIQLRDTTYLHTIIPNNKVIHCIEIETHSDFISNKRLTFLPLCNYFA